MRDEIGEVDKNQHNTDPGHHGEQPRYRSLHKELCSNYDKKKTNATEVQGVQERSGRGDQTSRQTMKSFVGHEKDFVCGLERIGSHLHLD